MDNIIFIGDSFCSAYYPNRGEEARWWQNDLNKYNDTRVISYQSWVAEHYGWALYNHGYGGKSWWYSRGLLEQDIQEDPDLLNHCKAVVFCHTNADRALVSIEAEPADHNEFERASLEWQAQLLDSEFQDWAQLQWFAEINSRFSHIKTIHFMCFPPRVTEQPSYTNLNGCVYTTPLMHLSIGELEGTQAEVDQQLVNESRHNHLTSTNNQRLAELIIESIDCYEPGFKPIDLTKFEQPNANAVNWPNGYYGSR